MKFPAPADPAASESAAAAPGPSATGRRLHNKFIDKNVNVKCHLSS